MNDAVPPLTCPPDLFQSALAQIQRSSAARPDELAAQIDLQLSSPNVEFWRRTYKKLLPRGVKLSWRALAREKGNPTQRPQGQVFLAMVRTIGQVLGGKLAPRRPELIASLRRAGRPRDAIEDAANDAWRELVERPRYALEVYLGERISMEHHSDGMEGVYYLWRTMAEYQLIRARSARAPDPADPADIHLPAPRIGPFAHQQLALVLAYVFADWWGAQEVAIWSILTGELKIKDATILLGCNRERIARLLRLAQDMLHVQRRFPLWSLPQAESWARDARRTIQKLQPGYSRLSQARNQQLFEVLLTQSTSAFTLAQAAQGEHAALSGLRPAQERADLRLLKVLAGELMAAAVGRRAREDRRLYAQLQREGGCRWSLCLQVQLAIDLARLQRGRTAAEALALLQPWVAAASSPLPPVSAKKAKNLPAWFTELARSLRGRRRGASLSDADLAARSGSAIIPPKDVRKPILRVMGTLWSLVAGGSEPYALLDAALQRQSAALNLKPQPPAVRSAGYVE